MSALVSVPALLWAGRASAQAPALRIAWQAPAGCPDEAAVKDRIQTVLGEELSAYGAHWKMGARASGGGSNWELSLELQEPERAPGAVPRQRVLRAAHCEDLVEAAAVAIALALGDARDESTVPAPSVPRDPASLENRPMSEASPNQAATPLSETVKGPEPEGGTALRNLDLSLEALIDGASLGGAALGASLGVGAWFEALAVDVHGTWLPMHETVIGPGESADFGLLAAGGRVCLRWGKAESLALSPCAGFELGRFSAESRGLTAASNARDTWLAPSIGADLRLALLGPLAARSRIELLFPLLRHTYQVDVVQSVHDIPALTVRWTIGFDGDMSLR